MKDYLAYLVLRIVIALVQYNIVGELSAWHSHPIEAAGAQNPHSTLNDR